MTKAKSSQARANKRNARAKTKKVSANKARNTPSEVRKKQFRGLMEGKRMEFDDVLSNAVRDINNRRQTTAEFTSLQDVLEGLKKSTGEVFKLYSYITMVEALAKEGVIDFKLVIDLKAISVSLIDVDRRIQTLAKLVEADEEDAVFTESLDLGTILSNFAEELYAEVERSETHALVIEESLSRLAKEVEGVDDATQQRFEVLQRFAYQYLGEVKAEIDSKNAEAIAATPAEAIAE
jgi:hypothetical protein